MWKKWSLTFQKKLIKAFPKIIKTLPCKSLNLKLCFGSNIINLFLVEIYKFYEWILGSILYNKKEKSKSKNTFCSGKDGSSERFLISFISIYIYIKNGSK